MRLIPTGRLWFAGMLVALAIAAQTVSAQGEKQNWDNVRRVDVGTKVALKTKSGDKINGRVVVVTDDSLTLNVKKNPSRDVEVKRDDVKEIRRKSFGRTATYAGALAGVGLAGGYGIGYGIGEATNARFPTEIPTAIIGTAAGAAIGAVIGSLGEVIYKVR